MKNTSSSVAVVSSDVDDDPNIIEHSNGNMVSSSTRSNHHGNRPVDINDDDDDDDSDANTEEKLKKNKEQSKRRRKNKISILRRIKPWKKIMIAVERQQRIMASNPKNIKKQHDTTPCEVLFAGKKRETQGKRSNGQVPRRLPLQTQALVHQQQRRRQLLAMKKSTKQQKKGMMMTNTKKKETATPPPPPPPPPTTSIDDDFPLSSIAATSLLHSYTVSGITALTTLKGETQKNDTSMFSIMPCLSSISSLSSSSSDGTFTITMSGENSPSAPPPSTDGGDDGDKKKEVTTTLLLESQNGNDLPWPLSSSSVQEQLPESKDHDSSNEEALLSEQDQLEEETKTAEEGNNANEEDENNDPANRRDEDRGLSCNHEVDDIHNNEKHSQDGLNTESVVVEDGDGNSCNHHKSSSSNNIGSSSMEQQQVAVAAKQTMMARTFTSIRNIWNIVTLSLLIMLVSFLAVTLWFVQETNKIIPTKLGIDFEHSIHLTARTSGSTTAATKEHDLKETTDQQGTAAAAITTVSANTVVR